MNNSYWDYLEHHGILGQKWGVRRGDHYPLEPGQHSPAEIKANPELTKKLPKDNDYSREQAKLLNLIDERRKVDNWYYDHRNTTIRKSIEGKNTKHRDKVDARNKKIFDEYDNKLREQPMYKKLKENSSELSKLWKKQTETRDTADELLNEILIGNDPVNDKRWDKYMNLASKSDRLLRNIETEETKLGKIFYEESGLSEHDVRSLRAEVEIIGLLSRDIYKSYSK